MCLSSSIFHLTCTCDITQTTLKSHQLASHKQTVVQVTKAYAARFASAPSKRDAEQLHEEALTVAASALAQRSLALDELKDIAKALRRLPVVDLLGCTV